MSDSVRPHRRQPTRLPRPWDSPGKNTGVDCHFLRQCMKVKSEREVAQSCPTLSDTMDCSLPGSSVHGIFQARVLEWGAIAFSNFYITPFIFTISHQDWILKKIQTYRNLKKVVKLSSIPIWVQQLWTFCSDFFVFIFLSYIYDIILYLYLHFVISLYVYFYHIFMIL